MARIAVADVVEAAAVLRRLLDVIEGGQVTADTRLTSRIAVAAVTLEALADTAGR